MDPNKFNLIISGPKSQEEGGWWCNPMVRPLKKGTWYTELVPCTPIEKEGDEERGRKREKQRSRDFFHLRVCFID
jgi:hypothetical protein